MKELICICCPKGCHLKVDIEIEYNVTGHSCERGIEYGRSELMHPVRTVTSTVRIEGSFHPRLPVKTDGPVEKGLMMEVMALLEGVAVKAPVHRGDVVIENILGTGVSLVACRDM